MSRISTNPPVLLKSTVDDVSCSLDIEEITGYALAHQHLFEKRLASPFDEKDRYLLKNRVEDFVIESCMIDRVYYIQSREEEDGRWGFESSFDLYCRMLVDGKHPYYFVLIAEDEGHGFDCHYCGRREIKFTKHPDFFFRAYYRPRFFIL